ncbi:MAG TPA: PIN domain-containing protein [Ktedonobacterales bacterium]
MPIEMMPANSLFVDTSGWADPVLRNTADHEAMEAAYKQIVASNRPLVTTNYVIAELVALLTARSRATRPQILALINSIKRLPQLRILHVDESLDTAAWELLERSPDKDWSLCDAASFVLMRQFSISEAFTSDRHFDQTGFLRIPFGS